MITCIGSNDNVHDSPRQGSTNFGLVREIKHCNILADLLSHIVIDFGISSIVLLLLQLVNMPETLDFHIHIKS